MGGPKISGSITLGGGNQTLNNFGSDLLMYQSHLSSGYCLRSLLNLSRYHKRK